MTIFLDLMGSWVIRASLVAIMLTMTVNLNNTVYQSSKQAIAKKLIVAADSIIYSDLNMAGYNKPGYALPSPVFNSGTNDTTLYFYGDLNNGGLPETIKYWVSYDNSTGLRTLYRYVDNEAGGRDLPLGKTFTNVKFIYYNIYGKQTTRTDSIVSVRVQLTARVSNNVSSAYTALTKTYTVSTDFRVYPANL